MTSRSGDRSSLLHAKEVTAHSSSLSIVASRGELENRMGLVSDVGKTDLMSSPWPVRAA